VANFAALYDASVLYPAPLRDLLLRLSATGLFRACIVGRADVIVTFNLKHFPRERLEPFGLVAQHPDEFIWHLCDLDMPAICAVVRAQWQDLVHPSRTLEQFLDTLLRQGLAKSVATLRGCGFDG